MLSICTMVLFQSTLPVGGATETLWAGVRVKVISIHAPRGGSDGLTAYDFSSHRLISIHAPRGGSDRNESHHGRDAQDFNPRSPWGERPWWRTSRLRHRPISIHAPRGGSDLVGRFLNNRLENDFNPRSPWGERPSGVMLSYPSMLFQSTLPVGGATGHNLYR